MPLLCPGHLTPCAQMQRPESGELEQPFVRLTSPFSVLRPGVGVGGGCGAIAVSVGEEIGWDEMKPYRDHSSPQFYSMHNLLFFLEVAKDVLYFLFYKNSCPWVLIMLVYILQENPWIVTALIVLRLFLSLCVCSENYTLWGKLYAQLYIAGGIFWGNSANGVRRPSPSHRAQLILSHMHLGLYALEGLHLSH